MTILPNAGILTGGKLRPKRLSSLESLYFNFLDLKTEHQIDHFKELLLVVYAGIWSVSAGDGDPFWR